MIRKQPSVDSTWMVMPSRQTHPTSTVSSSTRQTARLPYGPTPSPKPTNRPGTSGPLPTITQASSREDFQPYIPSNTKATFIWMRGELLGQGSYGRVYMGLNVNTGELMAVKQVELPREDHKPAHHDALRFLDFESKTLRELDHPNIVQYLGYEDTAEAMSVFLEYVPGGTIGTLLHKHGRFREEVTKSFTRQILEGLDYLHSRGIIHRDLKPDNILVEPSGVCKISDFGISKRVDDIQSPRAHTLMRGTVHYMAPEILGSKEKGYDGKIDIWSVGCMVMEMWTGEKPWGAEENFVAIMWKLREIRSPPPLPPSLQKDLSPPAHNFRDSCFHINPVQRPSPGELRLHPYLGLPPNWTFVASEVAHPSRERRVNAGRQRQRGRQDDAATLRPRRQETEDQDGTIRPQDIARNDEQVSIHTIREPVTRGPSPPIVVVKPLRPKQQSTRPYSPVDPVDQGYATSASSHTSNSRRSKTRKYVVANPGDDAPKSNYHYVPPPLPDIPPTSQPYSAFLGASSKYSTGYSPDLNAPSRSRSSSTPHLVPTPTPTSLSSLSSGNLSQSQSSSSQSSRNSTSFPLRPQSSAGTGDSGTWKRPPVSSPAYRTRAISSSSSPSSSARFEYPNPPSGHHSPAQLRTPPPPSVPPPLPPTTAYSPSPLPPLPLSPSPRHAARQAVRSHGRGDRPYADDIVRHLGDWFPDHDLDQPVVVPESIEDLMENFNLNLGGDSLSEEIQEQDGAINHGAVLGTGAAGHSNRYSHIRPVDLAAIPSGSNYVPYSFADAAAASRNTAATGHGVAGPLVSGSTRNPHRGRPCTSKSIRRIAEEQASKRQSNPGAARRRTLWDFKMEELKTSPRLSYPGQQ